MKGVFYAPLLFASLSSAELTRINHFNPNCTALCSQQDDDKSCWDKTVDYTNEQLVKAMFDYFVVQVDVDQWLRRQNKSHSSFDYDGTLEATLKSWRDTLFNRIDTHWEIRAQQPQWDLAFDSTAKGLLNVVNATSKALIHDPPMFHCPVPCSYQSRLWLYLFAASLVLNVLLALSVIPSIYRLEMRRRLGDSAVPYTKT